MQPAPPPGASRPPTPRLRAEPVDIPIEGGAALRRPRLGFDHAQIAVADLEAAALHYEREYGLTSIAGGRHPGRGTANRIIPLGGEYLELISVVDSAEASQFPTSIRVAAAIGRGATFSAWAARTDDLDASRASLAGAGMELPAISPGARTRPDGVRLSWRMQETEAEAAPSPLPFLIEWKLSGADYPGRAAVRHRSRASGVAAVILTTPEPEADFEYIRSILGEGFEWRLQPGAPGLAAVELTTPGGRILIG